MWKSFKKVTFVVAASTMMAVAVIGTQALVPDKKVEAAAKPSFSDISGHWAASSIETAVQAGILNGYSDGTYKPNNTITRAELLKVMALTFKLKVDSSGSTWYAPYQTALSKAGVYLDGDYPGNVNNPATRNEMAKLAVRGAYPDYRNKKLSAAELMFRAVNKGILSRSGTKAESINTEGTTTRAEAAVLVTRLLKLQDGGALTVDKGASSAAEIAWHRHNMITMFNQNDLVSLPYKKNINSRYDVTIDNLIVLDPTDKTGYYAEYLEGAKYNLEGKEAKTNDGYVFAYKLTGKNLVTSSENQDIAHSFYMYTEGQSGGVNLSSKFKYDDGKLIDRPGLYSNRTEFSFSKPNNEGHDFYLVFVKKDFIDAQIKQYGGVPIHLEKLNVGMNKASQFYLTEVKDWLWEQ
ncbi:S-layer homology domain-containing protein [Paenibacillus sp. MMO-58]|uniref:S-layer homology domain-containing protein n=1 Tax=Paenibacillus sp. MMO-58 TaxID=3081290 RepID=UPI0030177C00